MNIKQIALVILSMLLGITANAQEVASSVDFITNLSHAISSKSRLSTGDKVPDVFIGELSNYKSNTAKFSDFNKKLVILDFWTTGCSPCIEGFKKMEEFQAEFGDKIQIITVNQENKKYIYQYLQDTSFAYRTKLFEIIKDAKLPSVTSDTAFFRLFPHYMVSHIVWIKDGKLFAETDARPVTRENIRAVINDEPVKLPAKKDFLEQIPNQPLLPQIYQLYGNEIKYYSFISPRIEGLRTSGQPLMYIDSTTNTCRLWRTDAPILSLYMEALTNGSPGNFAPMYENAVFDYGKRFILETADSNRFVCPKGMSNQEWELQGHYVYEGSFALNQKDKIYKHMKEDLDRYFGLNGRIEKRKMKSLQLVFIKKSDTAKVLKKIVTNPGMWENPKYSAIVDPASVTGLKDLMVNLSIAYKDTPFVIVDRTNYKGRAGIVLKTPLTHLTELRKELKKYGLDLVPADTEVDVMVVSDN